MGTGIHGGFPNPISSAKPDPPVKASGDVRYDRKKTEEYLLNLDHPQGGPKAQFMKDVLGYSKEDARKFHKSIAKALVGQQPSKTQVTPYGIKHTFHVRIKAKNKRYVDANVVVVIQKDNGRKTHRIITVYPDKKG